ncbi:hypothetical protein F5884DRAFT_782538 [Xylogone sp. PMI_703]|nr:hypothetical protein F5884DRAFT_782538 [Xylogone sp. PMI_703]
MLPPVEDSVLQSNPKFALLYTNLSTNLLNPSGSTKNHPAQKERDATTEALKSARFRAAKTHFLKDALSSIDLSSGSTAAKSKSSSKTQQQHTPLPEELVQLIILLSARLSTPNVPPSSLTILESTEPYASLSQYLPIISSLISQHLQAQALALARILSPTTNSSFIHRTIPKLAQNTKAQQDSIAVQKADLAIRRNALVGKATTVLSLYHVATTMIIGSLEQVKHGVVARNARTRAEFLTTSARLEEHNAKSMELTARKTVYTDDLNEALINYMENLRDGQERLAQRKKVAERELWGYGVGRDAGDKEKLMREIARAYKELNKEIKEVSRDVERLQGR